MSKILITGATGFIGKSLLQNLKLKNQYLIHAITRNNNEKLLNGVKLFNIREIDKQTNWNEVLSNKINCIIHCAAKTHVMNKKSETLETYRKVNVEGTKNLAKQAAISGVKRFIFLSSIKVNGETTDEIKNKFFTYKDKPNPKDYYAISKYEAEESLKEIAFKTGLEIVIVRLPLVYGSGAKGNLDRLVKLISSKMPIPFGGIKNKRSLIGIDNLIDLIVKCIEHPNAANKIFLVSDGKDISTTELIELISLALNQRVRLFTLPHFLLKFFGFILQKQDEVSRLIGSLRVSSVGVQKALDWSPPVNIEEGIRRMIKGK